MPAGISARTAETGLQLPQEAAVLLLLLLLSTFTQDTRRLSLCWGSYEGARFFCFSQLSFAFKQRYQLHFLFSISFLSILI